MLLEPVRIPKNRLWPLPPDYEEALRDRDWDWCQKARVNGCLQWQLPGLSRTERAELFARCLHFFDRVYLWPGDRLGVFGGLFDQAHSGFYDGVVVETPTYHHEANRAFMANPNGLMIQAVGRGGAKSTNIHRRSVFFGLTGYMSGEEVVKYLMVYCTSNHTLAKRAGRRIKGVYSDNEKVKYDFGSFMPGGRIQGKRGEKPYGDQEFGLTNGAMFQFTSVDSSQRGMRPIVYELDDPERDAKGSTDRTALREDLKERILRVYLPMLTAADARMCWTGTFIDTQALLWRAVDANQDGTPVLPEFGEWHKVIVRLLDEQGRSRWPHAFPANEAEKVRLGLPEGLKTLEQRRKELGEARFQNEILLNPGQSTFGVFELDSEPRGKHAWWVEDPDEAWMEGEPWRSQAKVCWQQWNGTGVESLRMNQLLGEGYVLATLDTSSTASETSDRKVVHVMVMTPDRCLLSLDLWSKRCHEQDLIDETFRLTKKWRVRILWPEVVAHQRSLYENMASQIVDGFHQERFGVEHAVGVRPLRVGTSSKLSKISGMVNWFGMNRVKLPWWRSMEGPYSRLVGQIEGFNPEFSSGGLSHDDELDSLAMVQFATKMRLEPHEEEEVPKTVQEMIMHGYRNHPETGRPLGTMLPFEEAVSLLPFLMQNQEAEGIKL